MKKKYAGLFLVFFVCFVSINVFSQQKHVLSGRLFDEVNNTRTINFNQLDYYLSQALTLNLVLNGQNQNSVFIIEEGGLVRNSQDSNAQAEKITIDVNDKGTLHDLFASPRAYQGREIFEIKFKDTLLSFRRNMQKDRFDLVSVMTTNNDKKFELRGADHHLVIFYEDKSKSAAPVPAIQVPVSVNIALPRFEVPGNNTLPDFPLGPKPAVYPTRISSIKIEGPGLLNNKEVIVEFIRAQNPSVDRGHFEMLIEAYFREAGIEGINSDLAIAQMCYTTQFLRNRQLGIEDYNYAGFNQVQGRRVRFNSMTEGVRAHIQHLKGYSSLSRPRQEIVDPRWEMLRDFRGTIKTLDELSRKWAPQDPDYGNRIAGIIEDMRWASGGMTW